MKTRQVTRRGPLPTYAELPPLRFIDPQRVPVFGAVSVLDQPILLKHLRGALGPALLAAHAEARLRDSKALADNQCGQLESSLDALVTDRTHRGIDTLTTGATP